MSKWFVKFCAGDLSLRNAQQSDRPAEGDSEQIKTLIENVLCYIMWKITDILKTSKLNIYILVLKADTLFLFQILRGKLLVFAH